MSINETRLYDLLETAFAVYNLELKPVALKGWMQALQGIPAQLIEAALNEHARDPVAGKYPPRPADVIGRITLLDGRPGVEEAWALCPRDEAVTVCWTEEMAQAWGTAKPLLDANDEVAARMAFKEVYTRLITQSREHKLPVVWLMSLGHDPQTRDAAIRQAAEAGKIPQEYAQRLLERDVPSSKARLAGPTTVGNAIAGTLEHLASVNKDNPVAREQLAKMRELLGKRDAVPLIDQPDPQQVQATLNAMAREYHEHQAAQVEAAAERAAIQAESLKKTG